MPEITELFDVDVERVGLVKRGANRKRFFLMKSREDGDMDEKQEALDVLTEIEQVEEGDLEITHVHGLARITKAVVEFLFGNDQEQEEEPQPENDVRTEPEPDPEPAVKAEEEKEPEPEVDPALEELKKAHQEEIEKAQADLTKTQEQLEGAKQEAQEALEKAARMAEEKRAAELEPIAKNAGLDVGVLIRLEKSNSEDFEAVMTALKAKDAQIEEGELFSEKGSSQPGEQDPTRKILKKAEELRKADDSLTLDKALAKAVQEMGGYDAYREQSLAGGK